MLNDITQILVIVLLGGAGIAFLIKGRRKNIRIQEFQKKKKEHIKEIAQIDKEIKDGILRLRKAQKRYEDAKRDASLLLDNNSTNNK